MKLYNSYAKGKERDVPLYGGYTSLEKLIGKSVKRITEIMEKNKIKFKSAVVIITECESIPSENGGMDCTESKEVLRIIVDLTNRGK